MSFFGISIVTLIAYGIGLLCGFAACWFGVKVRSNNTAPDEGWGRFVGIMPDGTRIVTSESDNPSTTWSRVLQMRRQYQPNATLKSIKDEGYRVDRY